MGILDAPARPYHRPNTMALLGDSITRQNTAQGSGNPGQFNAHAGYFTWANIALRHSLDVVLNAGVSGDTTAQILARVQSVVTAAPGYCIVLGGTNDISTSVAASTTQANLSSIWAALKAANIRVLAGTIPPRNFASDTTTIKNAVHALNNWIKKTAPALGVTVVDWFPPLANSVTGLALDAANGDSVTVTGDGIHPIEEAGFRMGQVLAGVLDTFVPVVDLLPTTNADALNLLTNGQMTGNAAGLATSWSVVTASGAGTPSKVASADNVPTPWQQLTVSAAGDVALESIASASGWAVGDSVYAAVEFETDPDWVGVSSFNLALVFTGTSAANTAFDGFTPGTRSINNHRLVSGLFRTPATPVPVGATQLRLRVAMVGGTGTFRVRRAEIRKA